MTNYDKTCVLMFSGGRDSTLAAVRLARTWEKLILVTVSTHDLVGISMVTRRLTELKPYLDASTEWLNITAPRRLSGYAPLTARTCLPCHQVYLVAGVVIAERFKANHIALGYTGYQSDWTEQTPYAIQNLTSILKTIGQSVVLPVIDVLKKDDALAELRALNLSQGALEQKCIKQVSNVQLPTELLRAELDRWGQSLIKALNARASIQIDIASHLTLNEVAR